jgi:hypothetical protein
MEVFELTIPDVVKLSRETIYDYCHCKAVYDNNSQNYDKARKALDKEASENFEYSIFGWHE